MMEDGRSMMRRHACHPQPEEDSPGEFCEAELPRVLKIQAPESLEGG